MARTRRWWVIFSGAVLLLGLAAPAPTLADSGGPYTRQLTGAGTATLRSAVDGTDVVQQPEFPGLPDQDAVNGGVVNRSKARGHGAKERASLAPPVASANPIAGAGPGPNRSFDGLNFRQQRLANGGNQFSVEPPDQALCAGNGFVLESVNDVLRVYNTSGAPQTGAIALNTFYGYAPAIVRGTGAYGPLVTDPSCYYDTDTQRWFHVVLTLDRVGTTSALSGRNHIDLAVSQGASPTGAWNLYSFHVEDDGTLGQPNHHCSRGPCIGDYPHIGADKYGIYITTNEYSFFGPEFTSAQIYAISKKALANGAPSPKVAQFDNLTVEKAGTPGFTVWPATAPAGLYATENGGTEFFLSSMAAEEAGNPTGFDNRLGLWAMTNTQSLDSVTPAPLLSSRSVDSEVYGLPPKSEQKAGPFPLGQCVNDTTSPTPFGPGCWQFFFATEPAHTEVESHLDSNDTRMQQVVYANGLVWGALDTVVNVGGHEKAGIAWFVVKPVVIGNGKHVGPQSAIVKQGYVAAANNNVSYPALAVLPSGRGVMAFTLVGTDFYPSAGYAPIDLGSGVGALHVAALGLGPDDGFTGYKAFVGDPPRTRWGDYGAAVVDGSSIWMASEYIGQTCTLAQYEAPPFGSCGGTRASLGNWDTRITNVTP